EGKTRLCTICEPRLAAVTTIAGHIQGLLRRVESDPRSHAMMNAPATMRVACRVNADATVAPPATTSHQGFRFRIHPHAPMSDRDVQSAESDSVSMLPKKLMR